ncbi:MATE family efflux transporter [Roseibium polysiphoniae]|uniref:Multidrug-efflux transporter n=1 Tax=Roseibium polysiphoniae TaxID=2571221 RepID=A0A944GT92_9HYPH|nr:MATE family efflux transporter [Roseibium polysiphoniae]MBS8260992.1 MATE family efflux transporter [Roseibium polysiphoniae]
MEADLAVDDRSGQSDTGLSRLWRSDIRPTLALGLPLAGAQIAQMAINTTDVLMIGRLGAEELAASVLAFNMWMLLWFFGMGIIQAVIPLGAQARGRRAARDLRRTVRMGVWVAVLYCLPAWCITFFAEEILVALGQDPDIAEIAGGYMDALQWSLLPALVIMAIRGFLTVMERSQIVLYATLAGLVVNAALDYVLIFGEFGFPRLELVGAGIASVFTSAATTAILLIYTSRQRQLKRYAVLGRLWRSDWQVFFKILRLGLPIGITLVAEGALFAASSILMGWLGTIPLAAHGIALQLASITFMVPVGLSQAALSRVGYAAGKKDFDGVGRAGWTALVITVAFMSCFAVVFWIVPAPLVSLYLDLNNPQSAEVLYLATSFLAVAAIFQIVDGGQIIGTNNLRGLGDTTVPLIYAVIGYWVIGISLSLGLGFGAGLGGVGIWSGLAGGLAFVGILTNIRFYRRESLGLMS